MIKKLIYGSLFGYLAAAIGWLIINIFAWDYLEILSALFIISCLTHYLIILELDEEDDITNEQKNHLAWIWGLGKIALIIIYIYSLNLIKWLEPKISYDYLLANRLLLGTLIIWGLYIAGIIFAVLNYGYSLLNLRKMLIPPRQQIKLIAGDILFLSSLTILKLI